MQEYGKVFAEVYSKRWNQFSAFMGPRIKAYYEKTTKQANDKWILDLCCGTGQLCNYFLQHEYSAVGVDRSEYMLQHAKELNAPYVESGKAEFIQADVTVYSATRKYELIVSLYDSLNHLNSMQQLERCFVQARNALSLGGQFIFDLNTAEGLKRWVGIDIQEDEEVTLIRRGIYEIGMEKAFTQITGFIRREDNLFERFSEVFYNSVFDLQEVREALESSGFHSINIVSAADLEKPLENPETEGRVIFIAQF
jgi:SAM-dependent methyltransferase